MNDFEDDIKMRLLYQKANDMRLRKSYFSNAASHRLRDLDV